MAIKLPRFQRSVPLVDVSDGTPSLPFHIWWDKFAGGLEGNLTDITGIQAQILANEADIAAAQATILSQQTQILQALSHMPDVTDVHIAADSSGNPNDDQLPCLVQTLRYSDDSTDVTASSTWSFTTDNGGITATISGGLLTITDISADTVVTVTSVYGGITKSRSFVVYLDVAPDSFTTSGTASTSTLLSTTSSTMTPIGGPLSVTVGSSGIAKLNAAYLKIHTATGTAGSYPVYGIWQRYIAGVWTNIGTETHDQRSCLIRSTGTVTDGVLTVSPSVSGLTPGNSESFRFQARNASGTKKMTYNGTISVTSD